MISDLLGKIQDSQLKQAIETALKLGDPTKTIKTYKATDKQIQQIRKIVSRYKNEPQFLQMTNVVFEVNQITKLSNDEASWCLQVLHNFTWIQSCNKKLNLSKKLR